MSNFKPANSRGRSLAPEAPPPTTPVEEEPPPPKPEAEKK